MQKIIFGLLVLTLAPWIYSSADTLVAGDFSQMSLSGWKEKSFSGETEYKLVSADGKSFLRAEAHAGASALYKKIKVDLNKIPYLNWSWRIDKSLSSLDELTKPGDDYAARVYVIARHGIAPWKTKALNYVWSSNVQAEDAWPNAFTDKAMMIPLRTPVDGDAWQNEKVNVKKDFEKYFGLNVDHISGVAIMTDTDNAQLHAIAKYGDIYFTAQ